MLHFFGAAVYSGNQSVSMYAHITIIVWVTMNDSG